MRTAALLLVPALVTVLPAQQAEPAKMTDAQAEEFARQALTLKDAAAQKAALARLESHHFRTSKIKEREFVLYAEGLLYDRLGDSLKAASAFRKLEVTWPESPYLNEAQTVLAIRAIQRRQFADAEKRLRKALDSDIPVESKRRTQEMLLWTLAEQDRLAEGLPIVKTLQPLGSAKPTEWGLVAILEVLCLAKEKEQAAAVRKDLQTLYPSSPYTLRANLAWAQLQGSTGDAAGSAETLRSIIASGKATPETDEARLALATLLTDGKLPTQEASKYPAPQKLLAEIRRSELKGDKARKVQLVQLRDYLNQAQWREALDLSTKLAESSPDPTDMAHIAEFRADAFRSWTRQVTDSKALDPLLPYLDKSTVGYLSSEQRLSLVKAFAQQGLPEAARATAGLAPAAEKAALLKAAAETTSPEANPEEVLKLLPAKGDTPDQALRRAQALLALDRWPEARAALLRARPGPERVAALRAYLQRPVAKDEAPALRRKEAEELLARLPEKGPDREPIAILVADLRAQAGDWKNALALYPTDPQKGNRGWVALMRATCLLRLGQTDGAKAALKAAVDEPDFKMERQTLGKQLGL